MGPCFRRDDPRREPTSITVISPSLPRRDDFDLVAGLELRLRPAAPRQHVIIHRDRKMRALIIKLAEQRIDAARGDLARFAVDGHAHCITSLSMVPRSI